MYYAVFNGDASMQESLFSNAGAVDYCTLQQAQSNVAV